MSRAPALLLVVLVALAGCGSASAEGGARPAPEVSVTTTVPPGPTDAPAAGRPGPTVGTQPARIGDLAVEPPSSPTRLVVDDLDIDAAVVPVGVEPDGDMEVPPASEVGWYRFGPAPGDDGSAVLAAHVDYDGERGVFFDLRSVEPGASVVVVSSDGASTRYVVESVTQVPKGDLGTTGVFDRAGPGRLALITCGGSFDDDARSYRDNIVVTAVPEG